MGIITNKKLSNLSKKPPCPGIKLPESFKEFNLLKYDCIKSPKNEKSITKLLRINKLKLILDKSILK